VKALTGGKGVDAVIDGVGGDSFLRAFECVAPEANICLFGASGGREVNFNLTSLFRNRVHLHGCGGSGCTREDFLKVLDLFSAGKLKATVETTLPLAEAAQAHQMIQDRKVIGKIVLKIS
jgi:NADPH2:quinone reductase